MRIVNIENIDPQTLQCDIQTTTDNFFVYPSGNSGLLVHNSPSCIAASDFYGKKFVATKGFFAKDRKIAYTPEDCQNYFGHAPDLARKMTLLLAALDEIRIPTNEIWQGDFLFDAQSLRRDTVDNEECVVFHPNTIVYAVPMKDPLSQVILAAQIGVVWHTRYRGTDFDNLKISFDADANELAETPRAFCTDANLPDFSGQTSFTAEETEQVSSMLDGLKAKLADLNKTGILQSIQDDEELQLYLNTFENFEIKSKGTQLAADSATYVSELMDWVAARYDKEIAAKKQPKTQEAYAAKKNAAMAKLRQLEAPLRSVIEAQQDIIRIKELIIKKLNIFSSFKTLINTLDRGYIPVGQEGFAVSDAEGNVQKLVSRLEFSFNNFSKDVIKGWMSDKRMQESKDALIAKLPSLTDEQKQQAITWFKNHPSREKEIDWNRKDLSFEDLLAVMNSETKTSLKKKVKSSGLSGLREGVDYGVAFRRDDLIGVVPFNYEASKLLASKNVGSCEGKWCTAYQKNNRYWKTYTKNGVILVYFIDLKAKPTFGKIALAFTPGQQKSEWFDANDGKITRANALETMSMEAVDLKSLVARATGYKDTIISSSSAPQTLTLAMLEDLPDVVVKHLPGGAIGIEGDVDISEQDIGSLGNLNIEYVTGNFDCSDNQLTSLAGAPRQVGGDFHCFDNQLTSLAGAPAEVGEAFSCFGNQLTSLIGAPARVGGSFYCHSNQLTSLEGAPRSVGESFFCHNNQLTSLEGAPRQVGGNFFCHSNQLTSLTGAPAEVGEDFDCSRNPVKFTLEQIAAARQERALALQKGMREATIPASGVADAYDRGSGYVMPRDSQLVDITEASEELLPITDPKYKTIFGELWYRKGRKWSSVEGFPEGLDLENIDITYLGKDSIQIEAGGDWQNPVTFSLAVLAKTGKPKVVELYAGIRKTPATEINSYVKSLGLQESVTKPSAATAAYERGSGYVPPADPQLVDITVGSAPWEKHNIDILAGNGPASDKDLEIYSNTGKLRSRKPYGEAADRAVAGVGFSFPKELKAVSDIHFPAQLQGVLNSFGRGVVDQKGRVVLGPIGSSHAGLQKDMVGARRFYFGYSKPNRMVYVVAKNGIDEDFLRNPKILQVILSNIFDMLRLSVAGGGKLQFYERESPEVATLQKAVIQKAKEVDTPKPLIQALNVLDALDLKQIEMLVASKTEIPALRADIVKELVNSNRGLENSEFVSLLASIVKKGVLVMPPKATRVDYLESIHKGAEKLGASVGISEAEAIETVDSIMNSLLDMTKPQSGTNVGKGEIMFAMLMKGGAKKAIGDLDINGLDIEVKGIGARMAGSAAQGGVESHASTGMKLRAVVKSHLGADIYNRLPILKEPSAFNLNIKGCPALNAVLPLLKGPGKLKFAKEYVQAMMSMAPQAPRNSRFEKPLLEALLDGNVAELFFNYIMFHFDAYQTAAGWKMILLFDDRSHQMILLETPEDLREAIEKGYVKPSPFGFSSSEEKGTTAEPQKGWPMYLYAPGSHPDEVKAAREAAKKDKLKAALKGKIELLSKAISSKEADVAKMTAPAKKAKAVEILGKYKKQLADYNAQLKGLI